MKIANRIVLSMTLVATIAVIFVGEWIGWSASNLAEKALYNRATEQLVSVRQTKKSEIERYLQQISGQLITLAHMVSTVDAMNGLSEAYQQYPIEQVPTQSLDKLQNYYAAQFGQKYQKLNDGRDAAFDRRLQQLSPISKALQSRYIAENPNPLGAKDAWVSDALGTSYDGLHGKYHPSFKKYLEQFGLYDVFLIDNAGDVVYSVFKEIDFATNLKTGPYRDSGLARAYVKAETLADSQYYLDDFAPYYPSYEAAASFIATPIFDNGQRIGVLAFQMPVDEINHIMTFNNQWLENGLGRTGESYLVGGDGLIRSQPRQLLEDASAFMNTLNAMKLNKDVISQIRSKGLAIGVMPIRSEGVDKGLRGESGVVHHTNSVGIDMLTAFSPINALGQSWVLITEMQAQEALVDIVALNHDVTIKAALAIVVSALVAAIAALVLGKNISRPILRSIRDVQNISENNDLTGRLEEQGSDEIRQLAQAFNRLFEQLQETIRQFAQATEKLNSNTQVISNNMTHARSAVADQHERTESVVTAVNEMSASIAEVSQFALRAAEFVQEANDKGQTGVSVGDELSRDMSSINQQMSSAVEAIGRLNHESQSIASVLDVIQAIAEQTNLLALNAAIEAARAGEQGRGFAVVADEVRNLASKTHTSTEEIRQKIERLQRETQAVVSSIQSANQNVSRGVSSCNSNTDMLKQIVGMINELNDMNIQIATATDEQREVTEEINTNITSISDVSSSVSQQVGHVDEIVAELAQEAQNLRKRVGQFRY
ncbi:methyl-accepting chemotaxis protein [Vibrio cholerae]|uniref:methyl-accepting chemotaxis protein n=1 Tax=Vibrio cholerae TaxID=666 RepID=UPI001A1A1B8E|nr:methyl-accepting chemotaxis protein [Vibrio cholerae]EHE0023494.1 methyl-accepting chemotaxis protein [Vibrio cholerae]HAS3378672.1 methyl-accepting chemotaxis protein [Vibrio cholerae]HAS3406751.1 methyl-accepting chemotaxis protein [Vibrio cholerae]